MDSLPPTVYIDEVPKLALYPNIRKLGYVATNYTDKPLENVTAEIKQWGNWGTLLKDERMGVDGIFFDETPGLYDWRKHDYLAAAAEEVRNAENGLGRGIVGEMFFLSFFFLARFLRDAFWWLDIVSN